MKRLILFCFLACTMMAHAQKEALVLHYSFKEAQGTTVKDKSDSHADAKLMNGATVKDGKLVLKEEGAYLDMGEKAGKVICKLKDFTVFVRYKVSADAEIKGNGYFLWCFSSLAANKEKEGPYHAYRINEQRCETSKGGWSQETGIQVGKPTPKDEWVNIVFRQKAGKGQLYINGKLIGTQTGFPEFKTNFAQAPRYNWIGKAPFAGDHNISHTKISDFRIYNICMSDAQMKKLLDKQNKKKDDKKSKDKKSK